MKIPVTFGYGLAWLPLVLSLWAGGPAVAAERKTDMRGQGVPPASYFHRRAEGWFWYEEIPPDASSTAQPDPISSSPKPTARERLQGLRERAEEALSNALLEPTPASVEAYMRINQVLLATAGRFAEHWQRALWRSPELDRRLVTPVSDPAVQVHNRARLERIRAVLHRAAGEWGLWLFFRADCPVCHRYAPILRRFADRYGFAALAVSLDRSGAGLPGFPAPERNVEAAARLDVRSVPALFLVHPRTRAIRPVGYGYLGAAELERRIYILLSDDGSVPRAGARPGNPFSLEAVLNGVQGGAR